MSNDIVFTAIGPGLHVIDADLIADDMEAITYLAQRGYTVIIPEGVDVLALYKAASNLVDAVDRYTMGKCLRSELLIKNNELKKLL